MKQVKIFTGLTHNVMQDVNRFLGEYDDEVVDIKMIPTQYDQWSKVMVIYNKANIAGAPDVTKKPSTGGRNAYR